MEDEQVRAENKITTFVQTPITCHVQHKQCLGQKLIVWKFVAFQKSALAYNKGSQLVKTCSAAKDHSRHPQKKALT